MPEQIAVADFISETWGDVNSPTTSTFVKNMGQCRNTVGAIEEVGFICLSIYSDNIYALNKTYFQPKVLVILWISNGIFSIAY